MKKLLFTSFIAFLLCAFSVTAQDAANFYNEGVELKNQKKPAEAIAKFEKALALKPDYTEARYEWGWCQNDLKDYEGAIVNLKKVRSVWPAVPKVHFELGFAFEKTSRVDSAIQSYNRCLQLKPDYSLAHKQLGTIAYNKEEYIAALEHFKKYEGAVKDSITDYLYWYRKGFMLNATKEYPAAVVALQRSMRYKTDYLNTYLELGYAHSRQKLNEEAIRYYLEGQKIDPKSHVPLNGIAEVYRDNKKDINEAMNWYKKTLALNPTERKACFGMGYCLNSQQKYSEAIPYLKTAIEKEPDYTAAYVELGYSYLKTSMHAEAIENFSKAMQLNPANENSRYYLVLLYIDQKNKAKAQQILEELKKLSSKYVATLQPKVDAL
jgi:tetratricopeptide (TPR) repeat protein